MFTFFYLYHLEPIRIGTLIHYKTSLVIFISLRSHEETYNPSDFHLSLIT